MFKRLHNYTTCIVLTVGVTLVNVKHTYKLLVFAVVVGYMKFWARIHVQVTMYRRLRIGRDGHLDQSEA